MQMLMTMARELMALDRPTSPPSYAVKGGTAEPMGLKARITRARLTSRPKGRQK